MNLSLRTLPLPKKSQQLSRSFYGRSTEQVARELIGKALLHQVDRKWVGGIIVETEAYLPSKDPASHSARGKTKSNASMFAKPGTLYVYPIHAKYCMNAVTEEKNDGCAVLIRAIEPVWGVEVMQENRGYENLRRLTRGPAMLCQALAIDRSHDGLDLVRNSKIRIANALDQTVDIEASPRIGISKAKELELRFVLAGSRYQSR